MSELQGAWLATVGLLLLQRVLGMWLAAHEDKEYVEALAELDAEFTADRD